MIKNNSLGKAKSWAAFLLFASLLALAACQTLDFADPNSPTAEATTVQNLVTGIEAGMRTDFDIFLRVVAILGREAYYFEPSDPRYTGELMKGPVDPGGFLVTRSWESRYRVIGTCGILLQKAPSDRGVAGFAKTIIAYELLLNHNYTYDNGVKTDFSGGAGVPAVKPREALAFIAAKLDEAQADLQAAGNAFGFALSTGFAGFDTPSGFLKFNRALKARVAVYQGIFEATKYNDALAALNASFLDPAGALDLGVYHVYSTGSSDQLNPMFEIPTAPAIKLYAHPIFQRDAESGDTRFSSKIFVRPSATVFDQLSSNLAPTVAKSSTDRFPIIRNEELILLRAEANIGLGNLGPAQTDINLIRAKAGLGTVTLTAANAVDRLLHEKRYSLFLEGHRWADLRRYNKLGDRNLVPIDRLTPTPDIVVIQMPLPRTEGGS
jgi:hypothetical protein